MDPSYELAPVGFQTLFRMSGPGLPLYSARGLTQATQMIGQAASMRRTVNGKLIDLSLPQFKLFNIQVSGSDQRPPFAYKPGTIVTIESAQVFGYKTVGGTPERTLVVGSDFTEGAWTFYRPSLTCLVQAWSMNFVEWEAGQTWSMTLEEEQLPS